MSKSLEKIEKDNMSDESNDSRNAKSEGLQNHSKARRKVSKKKMMLRNRSGPRGRLSGGADTAPSATDTQAAQSIKEEVQSQTGTSSAEAISAPDTPPTSPSTVTAKVHVLTTGDPRADEMFECALHNLEEAGKALASLGENLEHELKVQEHSPIPSPRTSRSSIIRYRAAARRTKRND